ncbi:MAG: SDR family NAD(P)-dependent oxidoreductase, partial [Verrucomicrobia bacterium]|nr:SDR family NAD(P)-dependent oxidoreductase [Verrucomicrobiota bacterium]
AHRADSNLEAAAPWGGFIPGLEEFDARFFDISPREAELMDPQQRLFLQTVWLTVEDAGYKKSDLAGTKTGLFVGVAANDYGHLLALHGVPVEAYSSTGNAHSVLANRVSYFLDLRGPSEAIDTACSSSLVAIHRAIESIASGSSDAAIVGGVNVLLTPAAFSSFGKAGMLCPDGRCKTFDARANGYVRGEGVGAILLKPLSRAERDGDHICGVILGSAENHGGRVQGLTVPNPNAQAQLLQDACRRAGIDPFTIGYIEAHGTGTSLGDPIEINGLKKAFGQNRGQVPQPRCAVGSVKANIGHLETAAGIASVIKTLLAMRHRRVPGNIHLRELNPYIQLEGTPFHLPQRSEPWEPLRDLGGRPVPRRAGVSSFGFGGANAHVLLEEYPEGDDDLNRQGQVDEASQLFLFSARDGVRLREFVGKFLDFLRHSEADAVPAAGLDFCRTAYTLQVGREPMDERLALIAPNFAELRAELARFLEGDKGKCFCGNAVENKAALHLLREVHEDDRFLEPLFQGRQLSKLARLWVSGVDIDWAGLWPGRRIRRTRLPGYSFDRQRYWVPAGANQVNGAAPAPLHPLLHRNESTLRAQTYGSEFSRQDVVLRDHRVRGQLVLPGAASLELALAGATLALESPTVQLRGVVWQRPIAADGGGAIKVKLGFRPGKDGRASFEIRGLDGESFVQGEAAPMAGFTREALDLDAIRVRCRQMVSPEELYARFAERGLDYGPAFRAVRDAWAGREEALSLIEVPAEWGEGTYRLHPALVDAALQTLALIGAPGTGGLDLPFAVNEVACAEALPSRCYAYGRLEGEAGGVRRYELRLLDERGQVLARLKGLAVRGSVAGEGEILLYRPVWTARALGMENRPPASGPLLLFDHGQDLARTLAASGVSTVRVAPGEAYERKGETVRIRLGDAGDYARLIRKTGFRGIIHRWSHQNTALDDALEQGLYSVHLLTQALLRAGRIVPFLYVYPADGVPYDAVSGYAKSVRQEQPDLLLKTLGVEAAPIDFLAELSDDRLQVRYQEGRREIRTLEAFSAPPVTGPLLKPGGVYLVSGGAGGLGRIFAEYLVQEYDLRVVLAGRSELNEAQREALGALGSHALYVRTDVSTVAGANQVVNEAKRRYGVVNGVIHAAGELRDGLIWNKTRQDFEVVVAGKVRGAEALDTATSAEPLDYFILFSSTAGLFGSAGQSDYAYANAYLDAFAHRREQLRRAGQRSGRTLSLNWPRWLDGAMRGPAKDARAEASELMPLGRESGLEIFRRALACPEVQIWGCVGNREKIRAHLAEEPLPAAAMENALSSVRAEPAARHPALRTRLAADLVRRFAKLIKTDAGLINPAEPLAKYGFDSIVAVEFTQELEVDFGALSKTLLFEYSSLDGLAGYFLEHHLERLTQMWPDQPGTRGDA